MFTVLCIVMKKLHTQVGLAKTGTESGLAKTGTESGLAPGRRCSAAWWPELSSGSYQVACGQQ